MESKFIDRIEELNSLENEYNKGYASFVVIYGRRRVGKTSLINEFISRHDGVNVYFLATQESEFQNKKSFQNLVAEKIGNELLKTSDSDWFTIFKLLADYETKERKIIVIDEFQYLGVSNPAFPSVLQKIWDTFLKDANIMLILCGSLVSLMEKQALSYSSPLYGRRTAQIKLKQIRFPYYKDFFDGKTEDELIPYYAVTGGVPKYIEAFRDYESVLTGIENVVLNTQSFLYEEPVFLLQNEVSEIGSYFSLIRAISMGKTKLSEIATFLGVKQTNLPKYLKVLIDLDLISREVPITDENPEKSKSGIYRIKDNFIAFWFKFVYPFRAFLERGEKDYILEQIKEKFIQNYVSFVYEDVCREKMWEYARDGVLNFRFDKLGGYWGNICGEIDIVGIDSMSKDMIMGECKYSVSPKGIEVLHDLQEKAAAMQMKTPFNCQNFVIFSKSGFSKGLKDEAAKNPKIILIDSFSEQKRR